MIEERVPYECCGRVLWVEVVRGSGDTMEAFLLLPGDVIATEFHGACLLCGREHHWSPPGVRLRKLLARMRR